MPAPRICCVDKTQYVFCPHCGGSYNPNEMWKVTFCSKNCKSIYETCNAYANNQIKASEAKDILSRLDLSKIELFPNGIKKNIFDSFFNSHHKMPRISHIMRLPYQCIRLIQSNL